VRLLIGNRFSCRYANHDPVTITQAVKRIMQEARELADDPSTEYSAAPLEVRAASSPRLSLSKILHVHILTLLHFASARGLRMTFLCVFPHHVVPLRCIHSFAHTRYMWNLGVALHPARACGHRFRGGAVSFPDPATCGVSIPSTKHHAPHPQWPVRTKHQGKSIILLPVRVLLWLWTSR
jgi:hypothetical protein